MKATRLLTNHYDTLGISRWSGPVEINDALTALMKAFEGRSKRGDPEATVMLRSLIEAQSVLTDGPQRAAYDRSPASLARSFADVAYAARLDQADKLREVASWFPESPDDAGGDDLEPDFAPAWTPLLDEG